MWPFVSAFFRSASRFQGSSMLEQGSVPFLLKDRRIYLRLTGEGYFVNGQEYELWP